MSSHHFNIETIGVVGVSAMDRGIARMAAQAGLAAHLFDTNPHALAAARDYLADTFPKLAAKGKLGEPAAIAALERVSGARTILTIVRNIRTVSGDARNRPSSWLARRVQPGLSLTQTDTADINASNEAPQ
ncbi:3-hydroxyacyl-CoA dehydrogenase NAD-binding domain-containing protein [Paraburkholderia heleia]|uniref:3-hydroxyacyl-CoA dehydrogenase NAD-binding domain-containing protein n=1 Tax=Paraburkholderia heleia TaxID=634127 RepID=UPI0038BAC9DD